MKCVISNILKKLAATIEVEEENPHKEDLPINKHVQTRRPLSVIHGESPGGACPRVQIENTEAIAPPKIKRPRRLREHEKKWNKEDSTGLMQEYMRDYRAEGKDNITDSPNSKYVKKPKMS